MRVSSIAVPILAALWAATAPAIARAQVDSREGIALQNQIYQLRQEILTLRDQAAHGGGLPPARGGAPSGGGNDMVTQLLTRVDTLDDQVRQLRGRIDELQNHMQRQNADLAKRVDDMAYQLSKTGAAPTQGEAASPLVPIPPPPSNAPRVRTPEIAMQEGNAALARRDYPGAEQAAREVIAQRASPRAYDGQMLLAQALFGQRQYPEAAIAFDDTYKRNRKGAHAQDALLGLTNALTAINEKKAACDNLAKLKTEFPQPRPDLRDGIAAAAQRAGCR